MFENCGEPAEVLQVQDVPTPEPGRNEVRVRMLASPVNPSDLLFTRGKYGTKPELPATPGFEGVGVIDKTGPGLLKFVRGIKPGKRVAVLGGSNWQEYVVVSARHVVPVGDLPDEQAATFFVNPATAYVMIRKVLKIPAGEWLLQTAAGSALGEMVRKLGEHYGFRVINVVRRTEQAEEMRASGLTAISTQDQSIEEEVGNITDGKGVPFAIDAVGGETTVGAIKALASGGRVLVYGTLSDEPIVFSPRDLMVGQKSVEGFWLSAWAREQSVLTMLGLFNRITGLLKQGIIKTEAQEFPMDQIREAVAQAEVPGRSKKVILRIAKE